MSEKARPARATRLRVYKYKVSAPQRTRHVRAVGAYDDDDYDDDEDDDDDDDDD